MKRFLTVFLISLFLLTGVCSGAESITVPFPDFSETEALEWEFPYSDDYFSEPSGRFQPELAKASMGLAVSAFRNNKGVMENQYATYLEGAGFSDIYSFGYDQETSKDTLSGVIAHKKIGDHTLIAAVPCGQGYRNEWAGNLEVGDEERHVGFNKAAGIMEKEILSYIEEHQLEGPLKLWMSGFSRASAVSNLTAADMIDSGLFEDVYAYLFAVPRTTKDPDCSDYTGIYNICGKFDPIPQIPAQAWGYERYGTDLYTPAVEMDSQYLPLASKAWDVSEEFMGEDFWYNPEVNYQLHLMIEFLCELFPTNAEYARKLQDNLMEIWGEPNEDTFLYILIDAMSQLEDLDSRQEYSSEIFVDYLTYVISSYLKADQSQVRKGYWNPDQSVAENVMREHMPYTYIDWIFSDNDIEPLYYGPETTRRAYFDGDVDVEVLKDGYMISGIDHNGDWIIPPEDQITISNLSANVLMTRNGTLTMLCLPFDGDYQVRIKAHRDGAIVFCHVLCTPEQTFGMMDTFYALSGEKGTYLLDYDPLNEEFLLSTEGDLEYSLYEVPYEYSTTMIMAEESATSSHITIPELLAIISFTGLFVILLLFVCMIIAIVHLIRKKKRGKKYSHWFVIVPHLMLIAVFTALTLYFAVNLFTITMLRQGFAFITMVVIVMLSLRGLIRKRCVRNVVILAVILAAGAVNVFVYQKTPNIVPSVWINIIYCVCIAGLSALAASTFYQWKKPGKSHKEMQDTV